MILQARKISQMHSFLWGHLEKSKDRLWSQTDREACGGACWAATALSPRSSPARQVWCRHRMAAVRLRHSCAGLFGGGSQQFQRPCACWSPSLSGNMVPSMLWCPWLLLLLLSFSRKPSHFLFKTESFQNFLCCWALATLGAPDTLPPVGQCHPRSQSGSPHLWGPTGRAPQPQAGEGAVDGRRGAMRLLFLSPNRQDFLAFKEWVLPNFWVHRRILVSYTRYP